MSPRSPKEDFRLEQLELQGELLLLGVNDPLGERNPEGDPIPLPSPLGGALIKLLPPTTSMRKIVEEK